MAKRIFPLILLLAGCDQLSPQPNVIDYEDLPEGDYAEFFILNEEHLRCLSARAHYTGMEIVFTRTRDDGVDSWFADGIAVTEQELLGNTVTGKALYTEYEVGKDIETTVVDQEYRFRLDYIKGTLNIWMGDSYGKEGAVEKYLAFNGICEFYQPPMTR